MWTCERSAPPAAAVRSAWGAGPLRAIMTSPIIRLAALLAIVTSVTAWPTLTVVNFYLPERSSSPFPFPFPPSPFYYCISSLHFLSPLHPFPSPSHRLSPLLTPSSPSPPLRSRPIKSRYGVWGSAVSSPSGVWGGAPAEIEFGKF